MSPRTDAARNRQSLLENAAAIFSEHGPAVPLDVIATAAGVSIATLYRNFANREELLTATFQREIDQLGEVESLLAGSDAVTALGQWVSRFVEYARTKQAISDVLNSLPDAKRPTARSTVTGALERILDTGRVDGTLRADMDANDLLAALAGLWTMPDSPDRDQRAEKLGRFVVAAMSAAGPAAKP